MGEKKITKHNQIKVPKFQITGTTIMIPDKVKHGMLNAATKQAQRRE